MAERRSWDNIMLGSPPVPVEAGTWGAIPHRQGVAPDEDELGQVGDELFILWTHMSALDQPKGGSGWCRAM